MNVTQKKAPIATHAYHMIMLNNSKTSLERSSDHIRRVKKNLRNALSFTSVKKQLQTPTSDEQDSVSDSQRIQLRMLSREKKLRKLLNKLQLSRETQRKHVLEQSVLTKEKLKQALTVLTHKLESKQKAYDEALHVIASRRISEEIKETKLSLTKLREQENCTPEEVLLSKQALKVVEKYCMKNNIDLPIDITDAVRIADEACKTIQNAKKELKNIPRDFLHIHSSPSSK